MAGTLALGDIVERKGFVTRLISVINQSPSELERRLGFNAGRLAMGWALLVCKQPIHGGDFRFAGYTYLSGGKAGHPNLGTDRPTVHDDLQRQLGDPAGFAERFARENMPLSGARRIVKIVPMSDPDPRLSEADSFPPGSGVPQWFLTVPKRFLIAAVVQPGRKHLGGGFPDGYWADPIKAQSQ